MAARREFERFGAARRAESLAVHTRYHALHPEHNQRTMVYVDCVDADGRQFELANGGAPVGGVGLRVAFDYLLPRGVPQLNAVRQPRDTLELLAPAAPVGSAGGVATFGAFEIDAFGAVMPRQRSGRVVLVVPDAFLVNTLLRVRAERRGVVRRRRPAAPPPADDDG